MLSCFLQILKKIQIHEGEIAVAENTCQNIHIFDDHTRSGFQWESRAELLLEAISEIDLHWEFLLGLLQLLLHMIQSLLTTMEDYFSIKVILDNNHLLDWSSSQNELLLMKSCLVISTLAKRLLATALPISGALDGRISPRNHLAAGSPLPRHHHGKFI